MTRSPVRSTLHIDKILNRQAVMVSAISIQFLCKTNIFLFSSSLIKHLFHFNADIIHFHDCPIAFWEIFITEADRDREIFTWRMDCITLQVQGKQGEQSVVKSSHQ